MKYTINFYLDKKENLSCDTMPSNHKNLVKIRMRIRWSHGHAASFGLRMKVNANAWNQTIQRFTRGSLHGCDNNIKSWVVNGQIGEMETIAHEVMSRCTDDVSQEEVRRRINVALGRHKVVSQAVTTRKNDSLRNTLSDWIDVYVTERSVAQSWSQSTLNKYRGLKGLLLSYTPKVRLCELDMQWLTGFLRWLESTGHRNVTSSKMIEMLRSILHWAENEGLEIASDWHKFQPQLKCIPRQVVFLSWKELMRVMALDLNASQELSDARDLFCLQCFTSLRYSDVSQLTCAQVKADRIELVTHKTKAQLSIELNRHAQAILDRHAGRHGKYAMPQMTVQRVNLLLKEIGRLAHLEEEIQMVWFVGMKRREEIRPKWKHLSTHCGRRTFICCSLAMGIPPETVMRWTGHSNYRAMKPYIAVADDTRRQEMKKWDSWGG